MPAATAARVVAPLPLWKRVIPIAATALLPLSHALTGGLQPHVPVEQLGAILGVSTVLAWLALTVPTRRALRTPAISAVGSAE